MRKRQLVKGRQVVFLYEKDIVRTPFDVSLWNLIFLFTDGHRIKFLLIVPYMVSIKNHKVL